MKKLKTSTATVSWIALRKNPIEAFVQNVAIVAIGLLIS
jgi:hypothetical protein